MTTPDRPELEGEISDDYKDFIQGLVDDLQDLDVEIDEVQSGIDAVVDFSNGVIDSDTWTEEIDRASADAFTPLTNVCAATFAEMDEDG